MWAKRKHMQGFSERAAPVLTSAEAETLTLVVHESPAELLESAPVAHGPQGAVELVVGHHQVLGVPCHVYDLRREGGAAQSLLL